MSENNLLNIYLAGQTKQKSMDFFTQSSGYLKGSLYKMLLIMRLILIFLVVGMLNVSATTYGQQVTMQRSKVSIREVFRMIKVQTGYDVLWQKEILDASKLISVNFQSTPLSQVILACVKEQDIVYKIQDRSIVLLKSAYMPQTILTLRQDSVIYKGRIVDEHGRNMVGATVRISGNSKSTFTNSKGNFSIYGPLKGTLEISYIGYLTKQLTLNELNPAEQISVIMIPGINSLGEVNVVSTGYQEISKERATGSFEVITKEQLQHSSDPNLIKRLEGITTSMDFNNPLTPINSAATALVGLDGQFANSPAIRLTIRGKNTFVPSNNPSNTTGQVLVVIDGIASPYSIDQVDPNDVESITVLKDAAAASIWGSRAANGVIVVKTKRGSYNEPLKVSFNSNFNITKKLDLFYKRYMSTSEYIDGQIFQFNASNTSIGIPTVAQAQRFYSPVAEILGQQKRGEITSSQASLQLDALRGNDIRQDYDKYILRDAFLQSYSLGLEAGTKKMSYRLSGAYNKTLNNTVASNSDRLSLNYSASFHLLKNLDLQVSAIYSQLRSTDQAQNNAVRAGITTAYFPYTRLVDNQGNPVNIPYIYRPAFVDLINSTYGDKVLDLHFNPLQDIQQGYVKTNQKNLNLNFGANYQLNDIFSVNILYNYNTGYNEENRLARQNSFYMRDLITRYTTPSNYVDPVLGAQPFFRQIPLGGMYNPRVVKSNSQTLRGQINANKNWNEKHALNTIAGVDITESYKLNRTDQYYGYDENTLRANTQLNYYGRLTPLFRDATGVTRVSIPYMNGFDDYKIHNYSLFANGAYTYNKLYTLSASVRKDVSSEFGSDGATPFYSLGGKWNIGDEKFYGIAFLPRLQFRATFGYNGNVNPGITSRPLISYLQGTGINGFPSATITSNAVATNNQLRPEKTAIINLGLDFGLRNGRLSGSLEYYDKRTTDLLENGPVDPSTGYNRLTFNTATLHGWGTDLTLNSQNLQVGLFSWGSNFLFSYNRVKVDKLFAAVPNTAGQVTQGAPTYSVGYDLNRLFAYKWAGLDPVTGDPRGYLNGKIVSIPATAAGNTTFLAIFNSPTLNGARFLGSGVPVYYGSFRNTFSYGAFSVSANLLYKLGYYFRRPTADLVRYSQFFDSNIILGAEYSQRWKKPGDETKTNVPSLTYPALQNRDTFYQFSEINVLKGDHIRLQEVNFSYTLSRKSWFLKNPRVYTNISNLGVIWRANKLGLDPDINDYPNPRTYSFGFSANF